MQMILFSKIRVRSLSWKYTKMEIFNFKWPRGTTSMKLTKRRLHRAYCIGKYLDHSFTYCDDTITCQVTQQLSYFSLFIFTKCMSFSGLDKTGLKSMDMMTILYINIEKLSSFIHYYIYIRPVIIFVLYVVNTMP